MHDSALVVGTSFWSWLFNAGRKTQIAKYSVVRPRVAKCYKGPDHIPLSRLVHVSHVLSWAGDTAMNSICKAPALWNNQIGWLQTLVAMKNTQAKRIESDWGMEGALLQIDSWRCLLKQWNLCWGHSDEERLALHRCGPEYAIERHAWSRGREVGASPASVVEVQWLIQRTFCPWGGEAGRGQHGDPWMLLYGLCIILIIIVRSHRRFSIKWDY